MQTKIPIAGLGPEPTWKDTRAKLRADHQRLLEMLQLAGDQRRSAWTHPSFICVLCYRLSNYFNRNGWFKAARLLWHLNSLICGADVSQYSELGEGLVIVSPPGTALMGRSGRNLTVMPCAGIGGEMGKWKDIGAGPGLPVLGDDVILEPHAGILGPIHIGDRARIGPGVVVTYDIPADTILPAHAARAFHRRDL